MVEVRDFFVVAVENAGEWIIPFPFPANYIVTCSCKAAQINIGHQREVLAPVFLMQANLIHLLGCVDQVRIVRLSSAAAVLGMGWEAEKANCNQ